MICGKCNEPISSEMLTNSVQLERQPGFSFSFLRRIFSRSAAPGGGSSRGQAARVYRGADFPLLRKKVDALAKRAWPGRPFGASIVDPKSIPTSEKPDQFVSRLLRHARHTTELSTPWRTPRIFIEKTSPNVGGLFQVDEGWVRIVVGQPFYKDVAASRAILCHEVCHYILDMVDIRERQTQENERLTDIAMFVLGFGQLFLDGYRRAPSENRSGHRVGYLSEAEYGFLDWYVTSLIEKRSGHA